MPFIYKNGIPQCDRSGVYCITNVRTGKVYVGSATCIKGRLIGHRACLRKNKHDNSYLQHAWNKYGEATFKFSVLKTCPTDEMVEWEQFYIDHLRAAVRAYGYNLCPTAGSTLGLKWTEESKKRMSEERKADPFWKTHLDEIRPLSVAKITGVPRTAEDREKIGNGHRGVPKSEEHRAAIKAGHWSLRPDAAEISERSASKQRGRKHSAEHKAKISEGNRRRWQRFREERQNQVPPQET